MPEMTGLDRLRELAEGLQPDRDLWYLTSTEYDRAREGRGERHIDSTLNETLASIADQIEAEQEERITRRVEDREAAEWVRKRGGLEKVKAHWEGRVAVSHVEHMAERQRERRERMQRHIEYIQRLCRERRENYGEPKPNQFRKLTIYTPEQLDEWGQGDGESYGYAWDFVRPTNPKYRPDKAEPPAPKVLDADGEEIRVGDTVRSTRDTESGTVVYAYPPGDDGQPSVKVGALWYHASDLTHRAPVLAADGKPLRDGETAYRLDGGSMVQIDMVFDADCVVCLKPDTGDELGHFEARELTHERPDSWERLEKDIDDGPCVYFGRKSCVDCPGNGRNGCEGQKAKARDLVRRAKALAERDA